MTKDEVLKELKSYGSEPIRKVLMAHGADNTTYGVKISDMKKTVKKIKKDYKLSLDLFNTGIYDAMYMAGLIADEDKMTKKDLNVWAENSKTYGTSEYTVAWIAAESKFGWELANEWIKSKKENIASSGWSTFSNYIALTENDKLDLKAIEKLMEKVLKDINASPNRVKYTMNGFIISVGSYIPQLSSKAIEIGKKLGVVEVDMKGTSCKIPSAVDYINKVVARGYAKKKKTVRC